MSKVSLRWLFLFLILFTAGCQLRGLPGSPAIIPADPLLDGKINDYLVENIAITGYEGNAFCAFQFLDAGWSTKSEIYLWVLCLEYYWDQGSLVSGSGVSTPVALQTEEINDQLVIIGHLNPRDGTYYGSDVREIFPRSSWPEIIPENEAQINQYNQRAQELENETQLKANLNYSNED